MLGKRLANDIYDLRAELDDGELLHQNIEDVLQIQRRFSCIEKHYGKCQFLLTELEVGELAPRAV